MKIKIKRRIPIEEIWRIISDYEYKYGSLEKLKALASLDNTLKVKLEDWLHALRALREYEEEGEEIFAKEEEIDPAIVKRLLSKNMVQLLIEVEKGVDSISDLARKLGRSTPNVYKDLQFLHQHGLISFLKRGRYVIPYLLIEEIYIEF